MPFIKCSLYWMKMKTLIYGAGVIGSVYGAKLHEANGGVTLLARGARYEALKRDGVILKNNLTNVSINIRVPLTQELKPEDIYDLIIVTVRSEQIESIIPVLKHNYGSSLILFMFNDPGNLMKLIDELRPRKVLLGFPGIGGTILNDRVEFILINQQKTTIGESYGKSGVELKKIKEFFESGGFPSVVNNHMSAWLLTHAVFVCCVAAAIGRENGDSYRLGSNWNSVKTMVISIREGFQACSALNIPISPFNLKLIFVFMPEWIAVMYWQHAMKSKLGTLGMAPHANAAKAEMALLSKNVLSLVHSSTLYTPTLDGLLSYYSQ
jgi:2-dehydropantoate 2-reductase